MGTREILFRGKKKDSGEWVEGYLLRYSPIFEELSYILPIPAVCVNEIEVEPESTGQYTGLTDKNGRKVFEGDIVEIPSEDERYVIEWDTDTARFAIVQHGSIMCGFDNYWGYEMEVIDNVFDNPSLAGGESGDSHG